MPLMMPRERAGQDSMARAAPAGHSAPMPMPRRARKTKRNRKVGEKPAMKLQSEYQRIEIMSGALRPTRSASHPEAHAPTSRIHSVMVSTNATSVKGTPNSLETGTMMSRNTVKSNASSVQPSQAAHHAIHQSLVGSFHHRTCVAAPVVVVVMGPSVGVGMREHGAGKPKAELAPLRRRRGKEPTGGRETLRTEASGPPPQGSLRRKPWNVLRRNR